MTPSIHHVPVLTFCQDFPPHGRIVALLSEIEAGVIFPGQPYRWRLLLDRHGSEKTARTELAAKTALNDALRDWLRRTGLETAA